MAAPPKPWEKSCCTNNMRSNSSPSSLNSSIPPGRNYARQPPAPPPRPSRTTANSRLSSIYSGGYGGGGYSGYGGGGYGVGGYGSFGGYGSGMYGGGMYGSGMYGGMNRFGNDGNTMNSFTRLAEESSRPAFQSIESIVQAFGSVAMMLESTYGAVYNSFRAVLGVADNFSNLRAQFTQVFSAFAIVKTLRFLYRKLLVLLKLRDSGLDEDLWTSATEVGATANVHANKKTKSSWPILLFLAVVFGGPYLIWKMLSSLKPKEEDRNWANGEDDHFVALAEYDFEAETEEELSFRTGQKIRIAPKDLQPRMRGWLLACVDGQKTGIIPANYIKLLGKRQGSKTLNQIAEMQSLSAQPPAEIPSSDIPRRDSFPTDLDNIFDGGDNRVTDGQKHVTFEDADIQSFPSTDLASGSDQKTFGDMSTAELLDDSEKPK